MMDDKNDLPKTGIPGFTAHFKADFVVDQSVMAALKNIQSLLDERGQTLTLANMDHMPPVSEQPLAARIGI